MSGHILALDQGTTSTRSLVFDDGYRIVGSDQREFTQHFPQSGRVEHEAEDLIDTTVETMRQALAKARITARDLAAIGITNQRETTVVWDRETGRAIHRAIVWQDRRTAKICADLKAAHDERAVTERTGLLLDPYFSATKVAWILDNVDGARDAANAGRLAFGTVDSFLIWRLTGGKVHATDATNASRTNLFNIHSQDWDDDLLDLFRVPRSMLPEVKDCAADFGMVEADILGAAVPILGNAGDQQAATIGQACFTPGSMKSTYGTGCFALLNIGERAVTSQNRLLTTLAYRLDGRPTYALEGSIFVAGAAVQWLRDGLKVIERANQVGPLSLDADPEQNVILVPAFTGLGAPYWDPEARGALFGLTRATGPAELAKAALDSVAYQTADLLEAMRADWPAASDAEVVLRVDGGMTASDQAMQRLADILGAPVDRPIVMETTALGAAWLAGYKAGVWPDREGFAQSWRLDRTFTPVLDPAARQKCLATWRDAVRRTLTGPAAHQA
ncbi:MAG: glycerol kinase GlpK [Alphaproteobacteria bacterium]|nr:glycerol kinase GlpK [Alphaproteobacteria bacterium]